jgi:hypothetical protein
MKFFKFSALSNLRWNLLTTPVIPVPSVIQNIISTCMHMMFDNMTRLMIGFVMAVPETVFSVWVLQKGPN